MDERSIPTRTTRDRSVSRRRRLSREERERTADGRRTARRSGPSTVVTRDGTFVLSLIARFGVLPLGVCVQLLERLVGLERTAAYRLIQRLTGTSCVELRSVGEFRIGRAPGVLKLLIATPHFQQLLSHALPSAARIPVLSTATAADVAEQLSLGRETLSRLVQRWTLARGQLALEGLARASRYGWYRHTRRAAALGTAEGDDRSSLAPGVALSALLPPSAEATDARASGERAAASSGRSTAGVVGLRPAVLIDGAWSWSPDKSLTRQLAVVRPLELVCHDRSSAFRERVRRLVRDITYNRTDPATTVTYLPRAGGKGWRDAWRALTAQIAAAERDVLEAAVYR